MSVNMTEDEEEDSPPEPLQISHAPEQPPSNLFKFVDKNVPHATQSA
jgi:hypothetical protein